MVFEACQAVIFPLRLPLCGLCHNRLTKTWPTSASWCWARRRTLMHALICLCVCVCVCVCVCQALSRTAHVCIGLSRECCFVFVVLGKLMATGTERYPAWAGSGSCHACINLQHFTCLVFGPCKETPNKETDASIVVEQKCVLCGCGKCYRSPERLVSVCGGRRRVAPAAGILLLNTGEERAFGGWRWRSVLCMRDLFY